VKAVNRNGVKRCLDWTRSWEGRGTLVMEAMVWVCRRIVRGV